MADDISSPDPVAILDVCDERDECSDLFVGKRPITELMPRIDDLDPDTGRIYVRDSAPPRFASVPRPLRLVDKAVSRSILVDEIVARNLCFRRRQAIERSFRVRHARVME